ncbi:cysteine desulfurase [Clostridium swellfunianum]|uniref:cysteine desulfurase family protein n=1 Tax=Clostridium swellfunianum TaxID=1367462 RepID=UPI002030232B|nr:cysteine desulfurase family protein [Clostridium swellfunianum]MCM0648366.1 cysteine desulfurase [Clostridium swellfunianum]
MEVYLDNSATTKPYEEVIEAVADVMRNYYGNPSSAHKLGLQAEKKMNESRDIIAKSLNCSKEEIVFTSGGSESNNFLIRGFLKEGSHVITTNIEHPSVLNMCKELENSGFRITYLRVDERGKINLEELESSITKDTSIVSIMHVNNEIGVAQDIEKIGKLIKEKSSRVKFHVDAVQSYGKYRIDVQKCKIDLLSASGHKIHGPRGVGFAYIRKGLVPKPLIFGGGQERSFRSGTENLAAIAGLAKASEIIYYDIAQKFHKVIELKAYFIDKLCKVDSIKVNSPLGEDFSPYVLSVSFIGARAEVLLHLLEEGGIYVSTGSACSSKDTKDSHVLKAIGLKDNEIKGTIRFSFNSSNTMEEIDYTLDVIERSLRFLRRVSK